VAFFFVGSRAKIELKFKKIVIRGIHYRFFVPMHFLYTEKKSGKITKNYPPKIKPI